MYVMEWMGWSSALYYTVLSYNISKQILLLYAEKEWSTTRPIQKQNTHTYYTVDSL